MHHEAKDRDPVWDCTLIKVMREHGDTVVNPIYEWTDADIWEYVRANNIPMNPLYERGYKRVGCVGCPMATYHQVMREFEDYPKYKDAYIRAFDRMLKVRKESGKEERKDGTWKDGVSVFDWWVERWKHETKGQMTIEDFNNDGS